MNQYDAEHRLETTRFVYTLTPTRMKLMESPRYAKFAVLEIPIGGHVDFVSGIVACGPRLIPLNECRIVETFRGIPGLSLKLFHEEFPNVAAGMPFPKLEVIERPALFRAGQELRRKHDEARGAAIAKVFAGIDLGTIVETAEEAETGEALEPDLPKPLIVDKEHS